MNWEIEINNPRKRGGNSIWFQAICKIADHTYPIDAGGAHICDTVQVYKDKKTDDNLVAARIICADEDPMLWIKQIMSLPFEDFEKQVEALVDS